MINDPRILPPTWRKSSHSGGGQQCVEVAGLDTTVVVRDSKNPDGSKLAFPPRTWSDFIDRIRNGTFDP
jgi:hypothetical protein